MTKAADVNGKLSGSFTVPTGVPVGTKLVQFIGSEGSYGESTYTARGVITEEQRRRVAMITDVTRDETTVTLQRFDPLAQTFTLNQGRFIAGCDVWVAEKGTQKLVVQIRETNTGLPNQNVIAESHVPASQLKIDGTATRVQWSPVWLEPNIEYALVLLTDDAQHSVRVAELGKYDSKHNQWVTSQPYQVGVLLSSSNASTWTPHQNRDLTFRLLAAKFTDTSREIDLGVIENAENVSDLIALANIERPAADTDAVFVVTNEEGNEISMVNDQPLQLRAREQGRLSVKAFLRGSSLRSPLLYPGVQMVMGDLQEAADYVSRAIAAGDNVKVTVTYEAITPGFSDVKVQIEGDGWQKVDLTAAKPVGDGWHERTHIVENFSRFETRVKLLLTGNVMYRPRVRNLRVIIT